MRRKGLGKWIADRLLGIASTLPQSLPLSIPTDVDPFTDDRLKYSHNSKMSFYLD